MKSVVRTGVVGMVVMFVFGVGVASAQKDHCAILFVGQSLAKNIFNNSGGLMNMLNTNNDFKLKSGCSDIVPINGATGSSAADCAISKKEESSSEPPKSFFNCWINRIPTYYKGVGLDGVGYGAAFETANTEIDKAIITNNKRIIAVIWSQGEKDSSSVTKKLVGFVPDPSARCERDLSGVYTYCREAYEKNVARIFNDLRKRIADRSKTYLTKVIDGNTIPIFILAIGRRAFSPDYSTSLDRGVQTIREAQYKIVENGVNLSIAALGYDQPLKPLVSDVEVHPTSEGDAETAKRFGFDILSYFNKFNNKIPNNRANYIGPKIVAAGRSGDDILVTVAHSPNTSMISPLSNCNAGKPCGFRVLQKTTHIPYNIEVTKDGTLPSVNGLKQTRYRIKFLDQTKPLDFDLAFAYGTMREINVPTLRLFDKTMQYVNEAPNILKQKCLSTVLASSPTECDKPENLTLPIQPAFFEYRSGKFSNPLNNRPLALPTQ